MALTRRLNERTSYTYRHFELIWQGRAYTVLPGYSLLAGYGPMDVELWPGKKVDETANFGLV